MTQSAVDIDILTRWMDDQGLGSGPSPMTTSADGRDAEHPAEASAASGRELRPAPAAAASAGQLQRDHAARGAGAGGPGRQRGAASGADRGLPDETVLGAAFYLMEPIDGFNPTTGLPAAARGLGGDPPPHGPGDGRGHRQAGRASTIAPSAWKGWAGPTTTWSARSSAGRRSWRPTTSSPTGPDRPKFRAWTRSPTGWTPIARPASSRGSSTATSICRTCCSALTAASWRRSSTGS
jgi:hypothetical protein